MYNCFVDIGLLQTLRSVNQKSVKVNINKIKKNKHCVQNVTEDFVIIDKSQKHVIQPTLDTSVGFVKSGLF